MLIFNSLNETLITEREDPFYFKIFLKLIFFFSHISNFVVFILQPKKFDY